MAKLRQNGAINALLLPLIVVVLLLIGAAVFAFWAYGGRQDYKNNVDQKIAAAVTVAKKAEDSKNAADYAEAAKNPLKTYVGPTDYGRLQVSYPKTWSAYIDQSSGSNVVINGYFYPDYVPDINGTTSYALRVQIINQSYSQSLQGFTQSAQLGSVKVVPYTLPKLPSVVGSRIDGALSQTKKGTMIVLPLRDKTVEVWTEAPQFQNDFATYILPNLTFSP